MTTDYPEVSGPDLRANAFVGAWERIEAAQKLKVDRKKRLVDPLPEIYWATMLEADVLARLATADEDPGRGAGRYVVDREQRARESRDRLREATARMKSRAKTDDAGDQGGRAQGRAIAEAEQRRVEREAREEGWPGYFIEKQRVRVIRGDWAGRVGKVTKVYPDNAPPLVDVALDLLHFNDQPVTINVPPADVEHLAAEQRGDGCTCAMSESSMWSCAIHGQNCREQ